MAKKKEAVEEAEIAEEKEILEDEKEVWKLNAVESVAYEGMKSVFVGAFMIGDLFGCTSKKDSEK